MENTKDFFKIDTTETMREQFKILLEIIKKYSKEINVYENGNFLYFSIENIKNYVDYNKDISNYAYYNNCENLTELEFNKNISSYDLRNDLLEGDL